MQNLLSRLLMLAILALPFQARADGEPAGEFDYYVMALSWSANWCAIEGDAKRSPQCDESRNHGWTLHGLWPQFHRGWPAFCPTVAAQPRRSMTQDMADIMGTSGLAWYQWKKHGVCSGLSAPQYYALSRRAYNSILRPSVFRKLAQPVHLPAKVVEKAFIQSNPQLEPDMITVTCRNRMIQEVRICLSRDLTPVPCGADVMRDCTLDNALFHPMR